MHTSRSYKCLFFEMIVFHVMSLSTNMASGNVKGEAQLVDLLICTCTKIV